MNSILANIKIQGTWLALLFLVLAAPAATALAKPQSNTNTKKTTSSSSSSSTTSQAPAPGQHPAPAATQHPSNASAQPPTGKGTRKDGGASSGGGAGRNGGAAGTGGGAKPPKQDFKKPYQAPPSFKRVKSPSGGGAVYHDPATNRTVTTDASGHVRKIEAPTGLAGNKMTIARTPGAGRQVITGSPGSRVVSYGPNRGVVERPLPSRPDYIARTYIGYGRPYAVVYRRYSYGRFAYYRYVPAYYYGPRFYGWVVTPWAAPVPYYWGGLAMPWFGFYAGYFVPGYYVYPSPDLWLTDYVLSANLQAAYENQQSDDSGTPPPEPSSTSANAPATVTPEFKAMIAEEVRQQLAAEKAEAAAQPTTANSGQAGVDSEQAPPALSQKFFIVSSNLEVPTAGGQTCTLTPGDIIERRSKDVAGDGTVALEVISSKKGDCASDSAAPVQVQLADLQEMHNQLRQQIDSGLKTLADNKAKGLPAAPAASQRKVTEGTAEPAPNAQNVLMTQDSDAQRLEAQVRQN